jgi:hypothetical protein
MSSDPQTYFAVYMAATGKIVRSGSCRQSMVAAQAIHAGEAAVAVGQMVADTTDWVNAGFVEQRPGLADVPAAKALAIDEDWVIAGVTDGTEVWIDGALAGTTDATGLTLSFPLAAVWQVRLLPSFPWKPADCEVAVT